MKQLHLINIYSVAAAFCLCAAALVSCTDDAVCESGDPVTANIQLFISANGLGDLNATRGDDEEETITMEAGEDGEFIHSLCVFIVNESDEIEYKFLSTSSTDYTGNSNASAATNGNLRSHSIDLSGASLTTGKKTIYAFANWEYAGSDAWTTIINKSVNGTLEASELTFCVEDPANTIDLDGSNHSGTKCYIPMSGKTTANISNDLNYSSQLISLGLDRLVSKVRIYGKPTTEQDVEIESLTFSGAATNVPLFSDMVPTGYATTTETYAKTYTVVSSTDAKLIQKTETDDVLLATFYVNESLRAIQSYTDSDGNETKDTGFTIDTDILIGTYDKDGGKDLSETDFDTTGDYNAAVNAAKRANMDDLSLSATTAKKDLPRNYIYPITVRFDRYDIDIAATPRLAGIATDQTAYVYPVVSDDDIPTYTIELLDVTTSLGMTLSILDTDEEQEEDQPVKDVTWTLGSLAQTPTLQYEVMTYDSDNDNKELGYIYTQLEQKATDDDSDGKVSFTITHFTAVGNEFAYEPFSVKAEWTADGLSHKREYKFIIKLVDEAPTLKAPMYPWGNAAGELLRLKPITRRLD